MRTYVRSVTGEIFRNFLLALGLMSGLLLFEKLYRVIKQFPNLPGGLMGKIVVLLLPSFFPLAVPMALLVGLLLTYGRLAVDGEIIALRAGGAAPWRLAGPAVRFSLVCSALALGATLVLAPVSKRMFRDVVTRAVPDMLRIDEGIITESFPGMVLFVDDKESERAFRGVFLFQERSSMPPLAVSAERAVLSFHKDGGVSLALREGLLHRAGRDQDVVVRFGAYDLPLTLPYVRAGRPREEMTLAGLSEVINNPATPVRERRKSAIEFYRRTALPAACLLFGLIGAPLGSWAGRSGRFGGIVAALALLFGYYYLLISMESMVLKGIVPAVAGVWIPNLVTAVLAVMPYFLRSPIR